MTQTCGYIAQQYIEYLLEKCPVRRFDDPGKLTKWPL